MKKKIIALLLALILLISLSSIAFADPIAPEPIRETRISIHGPIAPEPIRETRIIMCDPIAPEPIRE